MISIAISITGGFNQRFSAGTLSVAKVKYAGDSMDNHADTISLVLDYFNPFGDGLNNFIDAVLTTLAPA